jgi:hypothetical protein
MRKIFFSFLSVQSNHTEVPECLSLRPNWNPPPRVCPPPLEPKGEQNTLAGEGAGDPIRTTGEKAWHSVYRVYAMLHSGQYGYVINHVISYICNTRLKIFTCLQVYNTIFSHITTIYIYSLSTLTLL